MNVTVTITVPSGIHGDNTVEVTQCGYYSAGDGLSAIASIVQSTADVATRKAKAAVSA